MSQDGEGGPGFDVVIVGGGSAGCVLANRLSADPARRVLLLEAGRDTPPGQEPAEVLSPAPAVIFHGRRYLWPELRVTPFGHSARTRFYEQARVMGGGSTVNAQVGNRGIPDDYREWAALGATGWDWPDVLPYFKRLERDLDHGESELHGGSGPIPVMRVPRPAWPTFSRKLAEALDGLGLRDIEDQNAVFGDGYFAAAYTNEGGRRVTAAMAYLPAEVRDRPNLTITAEAFVTRLLMEGDRAVGVAYERGGRPHRAGAGEVILSAGALHSPALLMRAGIGPRAELERHAIPVRVERPGVGENLRDHPGTHLCAFVPRAARQGPGAAKSGHIALRFSSGLPGSPVSDLYCHTGVSSAWHGVGRRVAYFYLWLNKPASTGRVTLAGPDPHLPPQVAMNLLGEPGDVERLAEGYRTIGRLLASPALAGSLESPFAIRFSAFIRTMTEIGRRNRLVMGALGRVLDGPPPLRRLLIRHVVSNAPPLARLLADPALLRRYLRDNATSVSHVSCTCRMGRPDDPMAVVDMAGRVYGTRNLRVVDASVMPTLPRANTNLPVIMVAEKMAGAMLAEVRQGEVTSQAPCGSLLPLRALCTIPPAVIPGRRSRARNP